jgi:DMSO reductase family type II enzyme molybdopterin subunit
LQFTRRSFLEAGGGALVLCLVRLRWPGDAAGRAPGAANAALPAQPIEYGGFADLYRGRWSWDLVVKGTHQVNCWYQRGCCWNVFVKEGIVWREEQAATYPQTNREVPDFNPRGCQKGACYSQRMYDAGRVRYPLKRAGARGEGRWKRISWKQALGEIADSFIDVLSNDGPGAIFWDAGGGLTGGGHGVGHFRTQTVLDSLLMDMNAEVGDDKPGALATAGKIMFSNSADDLFYSDLILIWGGNPVVTQIPNAHFIHESRYHGARIVTIAPDYSPSSIHADQWIPVQVGTDAALALSLAQVMIEEGLYDARFVAEQTDLPLLVRSDTRRFLRAWDLEGGSDDETFYVYDRASAEVRKASSETLALGELDPALEGEFRVGTRDGETTVTPVFSLLREHLSGYAPEATSKLTGVHPRVVRDLARRIAASRAATILPQSSLTKFYHALEMERAQILVMTLAGQVGRKGSGFTAFPYLSIDGSEALYMASGSLPPRLGAAALGLKAAPTVLRKKWQGYTDEMVIYDLARQHYLGGGAPATTLYLYFHAGLEELYGRSKDWDPWLKRECGEYVAEAMEKGWVPDWSKVSPRILVQAGGNLLRRTRGYPVMIDKLLPKLDLLLTVDWRMSTTGLHSDYVLPAAGWYEKDDFTWSTPLAPFCHVTRRAVEPLAESKTDWEFHCLLLKEVQKRAIGRGLRTFRDRAGKPRRLDRVYDEFTFGGRFTEHNPEELLDQILALTANLGDVRWEELKEKGYARFTGVGAHALTMGTATDIAPNETITANTWHTEKKQPWPTLTRRLQFYIDHDLYLELGEELPVHKENPALGGNYPLQMTGGHARWSIHAMWRDHEQMLQLQRGAPLVYIAAADARRRGIKDGDRVRVYNDVGSFQLDARVSATVKPGQVIVYHAWEPYQFEGHRSHQSVMPSPINPIHLAGGYLQLQPFFVTGTPSSPDRGTRVEVEPLAHPA